MRMPSRVMGAMLAAVMLPLPAQALEIFACEPEWVSLAAEMAPDARISGATQVYQDPHYIEARPSLIARLRRADLAVCSGAGLEAGWLPALQQRAANPAVQPGRATMVLAADHVETIGQQEVALFSTAHVHPEGNPHLHLDPERIRQVAAVLSERMGQADPERAAEYRGNYLRWSLRWQQHMDRWQVRAQPLRGQKIVVQHGTFDYFWRWLGMEVIADLEPEPGVPPTPGHLASLVAQVRSEQPLAVVHSWYQDPKSARWLAERTGLPVLALPSTTAPEQGIVRLDQLFDHLLNQLLETADGR